MLFITSQFIGCGIAYTGLGIAAIFTKLFENSCPCYDISNAEEDKEKEKSNQLIDDYNNLKKALSDSKTD